MSGTCIDIAYGLYRTLYEVKEDEDSIFAGKRLKGATKTKREDLKDQRGAEERDECPYCYCLGRLVAPYYFAIVTDDAGVWSWCSAVQAYRTRRMDDEKTMFCETAERISTLIYNL